MQDQYELLKAEDGSLNEILDVRQEEGLPLASRQMQQVESLDWGLQDVAQAMQEVRQLVDIVITAGLVVGDVTMLSAGEAAHSGSSLLNLCSQQGVEQAEAAIARPRKLSEMTAKLRFDSS